MHPPAGQTEFLRSRRAALQRVCAVTPLSSDVAHPSQQALAANPLIDS